MSSKLIKNGHSLSLELCDRSDVREIVVRFSPEHLQETTFENYIGKMYEYVIVMLLHDYSFELSNREGAFLKVGFFFIANDIPASFRSWAWTIASCNYVTTFPIHSFSADVPAFHVRPNLNESSTEWSRVKFSMFLI